MPWQPTLTRTYRNIASAVPTMYPDPSSAIRYVHVEPDSLPSIANASCNYGTLTNISDDPRKAPLIIGVTPLTLAGPYLGAKTLTLAGTPPSYTGCRLWKGYFEPNRLTFLRE